MEGSGERRLRILGRLVGDEGSDLTPKRLCEVSAEVTEMSGAGIMLMSGDSPSGSLCTSNQMSDTVEQLQYTLGEGPCVDAYRQDWPVLEPDLVNPGTPRWPAFSGLAIEAGVRAVFGFPLQVGAIRLGALNLCSERPRPLTNNHYADALVLADLTAQTVLMVQAKAPAGTLATSLELGSDFHYVVHQASGMVAAQLEISVGQALVRLRAYAFANDRPLTDVAKEVVGRTFRFDPDTGDGGERP